MTQHAHARMIVAWLNDLANLTAGSELMREIKPRLAGMTAMLAGRFPIEVFSRASLDHVARQCKFFPSYAELGDALETWWREIQPRRLEPPARPSREPYIPPPVPDWCHKRETKYFRPHREMNIPPPQRTVDEQLAQLGETPRVPAEPAALDA